MIRCTVNQERREVPEALKTWGQILNWLESGDGPDRPVVTAVRFQGVDRPSFREGANLALPAADVSPADIEISTARELVADAADAVRAGLAPLSFAALHAADAFRRHDLEQAHPALADFVGTFHALARLTAAIEELGPETLFDAQAHTFLQRLHGSLDSLIAVAAGEDWISVADVLEEEIAELVPQWGALLRHVDRDELAARRVS